MGEIRAVAQHKTSYVRGSRRNCLASEATAQEPLSPMALPVAPSVCTGFPQCKLAPRRRLAQHRVASRGARVAGACLLRCDVVQEHVLAWVARILPYDEAAPGRGV